MLTTLITNLWYIFMFIVFAHDFTICSIPPIIAKCLEVKGMYTMLLWNLINSHEEKINLYAYVIFKCDETTCSAMKVKMSRILFTCCRKQEKILFTKTRMHKYKVERIQIDISHWLFTGGKYCVQLFMHSFCAMLYSLVF